MAELESGGNGRISRRKFLLGSAVVLTFVRGYKFVNNSQMNRLKVMGSSVPCDFHTHPNKNAPLESLLDMLGSEGLVGLATKPHRQNFLSYDMAKALVGDYTSFYEITSGHLAKFRKGYFMRTQEIFAGKHHVLCFGVEGEDLPNFDSYEDAIKTIHKNNGIAILCHPYLLSSDEEIIGYRQVAKHENGIVSFAYEKADEVETHNSQCLNHIPFAVDNRMFNRRALEEADKHFHIKGIAVSDAHREPEQAKTAGIYIEKSVIESGVEEIKKAVINGDFDSYTNPDKGPYVSRASYLQGHVLDRVRWGI